MKNSFKAQPYPLLLSIITGLGACSANPPAEQMSIAEHLLQESAINRHGEFAPLEMSMARDHFNAAKQALKKQDYVQARRLAEKTIVEVETANAKADFVRSNNALDQVAEGNQDLRQVIQQKNPAERTQ